MREIITSVRIAAAPAAVWQVLTQFAAYPDWNPFIVAIEGELVAGGTLRTAIQPPGRGLSRFTPKVLIAEPERELRWLGTLPIPGMFRGEHRFVLHPEDVGTRLEHGERFTGLLVPMLGGLLADTERGFLAMNDALKHRAENLSSLD